MRRKLFISHASPEDNTFSTWLYFKLIGMGYDVWCDVVTLKSGEYFWDKIEELIRNETIKFLFVASASSAVKRAGVSDEFEFARSIAKDENLERFIYMLKIDDVATNARIGQNRINHIDFSNSWADGLAKLLKELNEEGVPSDVKNFDIVSSLWNGLLNENELLIEREEIYSSNRFPIKLPETLYCHAFSNYIDTNVKRWRYPYPVHFYGDYTLTFGDFSDFEMSFERLIAYPSSDTISIPVSEILDGSYDTQFLNNQDALNAIRYLKDNGGVLSPRGAAVKTSPMASANLKVTGSPSAYIHAL